MSFQRNHSFVRSLNYHGGAIVVNTIPDACYGFLSGKCPPHHHFQDESVRRVADSYASEWLKQDSNYCSSEFPDCTTIGADWYEITGSLQDFENYFMKENGHSITVEIGYTKWP